MTPAMRAGMERTKRPCRWCGRVMVASGMSTHEPACDPAVREARRIARRDRGREVRSRPGYVRPFDKKEPCPRCGTPKVLKSALCKGCDKGGPRPQPVAPRFWEKVDKSGECWLWTGAVDANGYGRISMYGWKSEKASRVAWLLTHGDSGSLQVLHRCDNPPCVRPAHLFLGTQADNIADMISKGRGSWQKRAVA